MNGPPPPKAGLVLVGYRGTGKTTVGRALARRLGLPFVDADEELEARAGRPVGHLFRDLGEPGFRDLEEALILELAGGPSAVVATGGGAVLRESNRAALGRFGRVVWLRAAPGILAERLGSDPTAVATRPALTPAGTLAEIADVLAAREPLYRALADHSVETAGRDPEGVVAAIMAALLGPAGL